MTRVLQRRAAAGDGEREMTAGLNVLRTANEPVVVIAYGLAKGSPGERNTLVFDHGAKRLVSRC